jgi:hypothetical protein
VVILHVQVKVSKPADFGRRGVEFARGRVTNLVMSVRIPDSFTLRCSPRYCVLALRGWPPRSGAAFVAAECVADASTAPVPAPGTVDTGRRGR